jgi:hypothetical protein
VSEEKGLRRMIWQTLRVAVIIALLLTAAVLAFIALASLLLAAVSPPETSLLPQEEASLSRVVPVMLGDPFLQRVFSQANWTVKSVSGMRLLTEQGLSLKILVVVELDRPVWVSGTFRDYCACCETEWYRAKMWAKTLYVVIMHGKVQHVQPIPAIPPPGDPPEPVPEAVGVAELAERVLGGRPLLVGVVYGRGAHPSGVAWFASPPQGNRTTVVIVDIAEKKVVDSFTLRARGG